MKSRIISFTAICLALMLSGVSWAATRTSSQSGNWSDTATWGGSAAPGIGDTASIGNHTVTVDVNTTVGTSPNDNTTYVITVTSGKLVIGTGITLTIRGNVNNSPGFTSNDSLVMNAGSSIVFDNSASGGSPVYRINGSFFRIQTLGSSGSHCAISAISGQTCQIVGAQWYNTASKAIDFSYTDFTRVAAFTLAINADSGASISHCTFTSCGLVNLSSGGDVDLGVSVTDNTWASSTDSTDSLKLDFSSAASGTREMLRNATDKGVIYTALSFAVTGNFIGGAWTTNNTTTTSSNSGNFYYCDESANSGAGAIFTRSLSGNYFYSVDSTGNPHFMTLYAEAADQTVSGCVFEYDAADQTDSGDCIFPYSSSGNSVIIQNNIVLPSSFSGNVYSAGMLATHFSTDADRRVKYYHNTVFNRNSASGSAAINIAEGATGAVSELYDMKSNLFWSNSAATGLKVSRLNGTTNGLIRAAGANYNWSYNSADGDNGLGYNDVAGNLNLWDGSAATTGDAAAEGVDANGGTGDPNFVDSTRNLKVWANARGYGSTSADGLAALKADVSRIDDLITYVFEGFKVRNSSMFTSGHDGSFIGAAGVGVQPAIIIQQQRTRGQ